MQLDNFLKINMSTYIKKSNTNDAKLRQDDQHNWIKYLAQKVM